MYAQKLKLSATLLTFLMVTAPPVQGQSESICPPATSILPCACQVVMSSLKLTCAGDSISQQIIDNLFTAARSANNISSSDSTQWLNLYLFDVRGANNLTSLDLTSFARVNFNAFIAYLNPALGSIQGGTNSSAEIDIEPYRFVAKEVDFWEGNLTDPDFEELLKFIAPDSLISIGMMANGIQGSQSSSTHEFLTGLSNFRKLELLNLSDNKILKISGGQFKSNNRLKNLFLEDNQINELGENAFLFEQVDADMADETLAIFLSGNELDDDKIWTDIGLNSVGRPVSLHLTRNQFVFISAEKFEKFLTADERNLLSLGSNQFFCDDKMQWLRDNRAQFEHRVLQVDCVNDPGKNIFTTNLLP